jgi:DNA-binding response OmpR family regulator
LDTVILVVTCDSGVGDLLTAFFSSHGFCVCVVADGANALLRFGLAQPNLVILDMEPANRDAWQTLQRLRTLSSVPIVVLGGIDDSVGIDTLLQGADGFVPRPISMRELKARVLALLRRSRGQVLQPAGEWVAPA